MKKAYISRNYKDKNSAGGKAKSDIEHIIRMMGYRNVALRQSAHKNRFIDFTRNLSGIIKSIFCMPRKSLVILQYPMKKYYSFICTIAHTRNAKVVTVIHDLGTFRRKKLSPKKEIKRLSNSDYIIAQNDTMRNWLIENGYKNEVGILDIFDYLSDSENTSGEETNPQIKYIVNYAGGLTRRKNSFLYEISPYIHSYDFHLYGNGFTDTPQNPNFVYKGFMHSDDFINSISGNFGLVWDGDSLDTCSGNFGEYLKYNTPHKISFYIRAHLPVIIWQEAAMASFIEKEGIGFTISSLKELDDILRDFPVEKYNEMKRNTISLSKKLKEGYFITEATKKAIEHFKKPHNV